MRVLEAILVIGVLFDCATWLSVEKYNLWPVASFLLCEVRTSRSFRGWKNYLRKTRHGAMQQWQWFQWVRCFLCARQLILFRGCFYELTRGFLSLGMILATHAHVPDATAHTLSVSDLIVSDGFPLWAHKIEGLEKRFFVPYFGHIVDR